MRLADACYHSLRLIGWLAVTLACVAAVWLLFFAALGNFSFGGTVLQLENFASRYVAASAERQDRFAHVFWLTSAGLFAAVGYFRRHSLLTRGAAVTSHSRETHHG
ncbi:hypothetical protein [Novosphingobium aerophilum]|uniref:hypothetical protein n=1 Tax=Novosphingobium aerophilum TaxID=2839843 RepID=UPI001FD28B7A|nr:hypothetical protein [Novosphingobium aerophilum]